MRRTFASLATNARPAIRCFAERGVMDEGHPIAILGTGGVALSLALALAAKRKRVIFGTREPTSDKAVQLVSQVPGSRAATHAEACKACQIIWLTTPGGSATYELFEKLYKAALISDDKVVVDLTNPFADNHSKNTSGGERLQEIGGPAVRIVKTLNSVGHNKYTAPTVNGIPIDMFVAGDNADARNIIMALVRELGFNAVDAGGISSSRWMEGLCYGWVHMAHAMGWGRDIGWKLMRTDKQ